MYFDSKILANIKRQIKFKEFLTFLCVAILIFGTVSFFFYGFGNVNKAIKIITSGKSINLEKVMTNPQIKYEHSDGSVFDIHAKRAVQKGQNDVELQDVFASGDIGQISAGKLLITNNGNDLHFSDHPVLIIREAKNGQ